LTENTEELGVSLFTCVLRLLALRWQAVSICSCLSFSLLVFAIFTVTVDREGRRARDFRAPEHSH
jgi:hypothetical protein